jgi:CO/xanthine dehydrogenase FAD-binding subunit
MIEAYHRPTTLGEALELKSRHGAEARFVVGGTDLLVKLRAGIVGPRHIIDLSRVSELRGMRRTDTHLVFGATTTAEDCIGEPWIREQFPALWRSAQWLGGPQMQHVATLGGNLGNASPAADTVPSMMVAGAEITLAGAAGTRKLAIEDFLVGPGRTVIAPGEIIREIAVPLAAFAPADPRALLNPADAFRLNVLPARGPLPDGTGEWTTNMFYKAGARLAQVISIVCMAGWARMDGRRVVDIRLAFGSAAPVTKRGLNAESVVRGRELTADLVEEAAAAVLNDVSPITDVRGSADYKRLLCQNYTRLFLQDLAGLKLTGVARATNAA